MLAFPLGLLQVCWASGFLGSPPQGPGGLATPAAGLGLGRAVCPLFIQTAEAVGGMNKCWHHCHDLSGEAE